MPLDGNLPNVAVFMVCSEWTWITPWFFPWVWPPKCFCNLCFYPTQHTECTVPFSPISLCTHQLCICVESVSVVGSDSDWGQNSPGTLCLTLTPFPSCLFASALLIFYSHRLHPSLCNLNRICLSTCIECISRCSASKNHLTFRKHPLASDKSIQIIQRHLFLYQLWPDKHWALFCSVFRVAQMALAQPCPSAPPEGHGRARVPEAFPGPPADYLYKEDPRGHPDKLTEPTQWSVQLKYSFHSRHSA